MRLTKSLVTCPDFSSVKKMYETGLAELSLFAGGFINFGFWEFIDLDKKKLSIQDRIESEKNLYRYLAKRLSISNCHYLLEVGCGLGLGCKLIIEEFQPLGVSAIDFSDSQISKARINNKSSFKNNRKVKFSVASAEALPFNDNSFDRVLSVEAAQHFTSISNFFNEAYRVLNRGGKIGVTTFFACSNLGSNLSAELIPTVKNGIDKMLPVNDVTDCLIKSGFKEVKVESIGDHVWKGFDKWVSQGDCSDTWDRNWYMGYERGLFDYYVITAQK